LSGSLFGIPAVHVQSVQKAIAEVTGLEGVDFVADLQHLHDHNKDTQEMQVAFIIFARKQNLTIPELS
jgi:ADP-ribose pyrophosphatase YjhB (NUDIX family)